MSARCLDHWHCDPELSAHACDVPDRTKPCPNCGQLPPVEERYPEHAKQAAVIEDARKLGAFLEALESEGRRIAGPHIHSDECDRVRSVYTPGRVGARVFVGRVGSECGQIEGGGEVECPLYEWQPPGRGNRIERILAAYFGIDLERISAEKDEMVRELQQQATPTREKK
jgi:hypothetical protein